MTENAERPALNNHRVLGMLLVCMGVLFLIGQMLRVELGWFSWPFFVIVPGVLLMAAALIIGDKTGEALVIIGSIITSTGLLLLYQNTFGHWESWAYAWALVAPTSIGVGLFLFGAVRGRADRAREGLRMAGVGVVMFLVAGSFFELVLGFDGLGLGKLGWSIALIVLGVVLVLSNLINTLRDRAA